MISHYYKLVMNSWSYLSKTSKHHECCKIGRCFDLFSSIAKQNASTRLKAFCNGINDSNQKSNW